MKKSSLLLIVSAVALTSVAVAAHAATPAAAAPAARPAAAAPAPIVPPTFGAPVAGQCILDEQAAVGQSAMGKAASDRLVQLKAMVDAELSPEGTALETEYKSLAVKQKAATTPALKTAFETQATAWQGKRDAFQSKMQQRNQEMQATQQEVLQAIFQKMIPQINAVVTQRGCSTVATADSLVHYDMTAPNASGQPTETSFVYVNPSMDITSAVVAKLDSTGETLPAFNRVSLDQQGAGK